ncbi:hypothetical protein B296_00036125 [Ensete ventricosum]|uniref:Uncharacterized protein n=1 Tax=Ensete ventricosum TaxID=4639 RepID=A0A427A3M3_ENSVE|nr:hypothetical protein B296_00036125 [Ensete ventricosum]
MVLPYCAQRWPLMRVDGLPMIIVLVGGLATGATPAYKQPAHRHHACRWPPLLFSDHPYGWVVTLSIGVMLVDAVSTSSLRYPRDGCDDELLRSLRDLPLHM